MQKHVTVTVQASKPLIEATENKPEGVSSLRTKNSSENVSPGFKKVNFVSPIDECK